MNKEIKEELLSIMAISERYKDCDACALINERVSKIHGNQHVKSGGKDD